MEMRNYTAPSRFIFLGFPSLPKLQMLLFAVVLVIYMVTWVGNGIIIIVTRMDANLHKPMYYFLGNLSFLDICYTSVTLPKMLENLLQEKKTISYEGCIVQLFFFLCFLGTECVLLAVMAYDRYVAICNPLHYLTIMSKKVCGYLATFSWLAGLVDSAVHTYFTFRLPFCASNELNYFFCDIPPLLSLSCADTSINQTVLLVAGTLIAWTPFLCIITSYVYIISAILRISSSEGRQKAFSTCSSHITVVIFFFATAVFTYMRPISSYSLDRDRLLSLLYSFVTPMLNPAIYTLKNKDVKSGLRKVRRYVGTTICIQSGRFQNNW
ncbi:olfactory receptor 5V1-like [Rhinatrema bivittatum]|uniref:olfactory receptor 5V1-like n=1 Tax=Rhinatrema bivittatum TaxID=194408 RepID=UPI001127B1CA|nr:olfactory receptor 5V1-like [Rhinatrema bivittatum]